MITALTDPVSILTGGPGCGTTHTMLTLVATATATATATASAGGLNIALKPVS